MSQKTTYAIEQVQLAYAVLDKFDKLDLREVELTEGGFPLPVSDKMLEQWRFIGLNNSTLVELRFWEEGGGVRCR